MFCDFAINNIANESTTGSENPTYPGEIERKVKSQEQKSAEKDRQFALRQEKKKAKHRGGSHKMVNLDWIRCPICGNKTRNRVRPDTILIKYPLFCPKCKQETLGLV